MKRKCSLPVTKGREKRGDDKRKGGVGGCNARVERVKKKREKKKGEKTGETRN